MPTSATTGPSPVHSTAQDRWFVAANGTRRLYAFKKQDDHGLQLATLVRQLSSAGWVSRERFDPKKVLPT